MDNSEKRQFSEEEIRKIDPGYRGKPENFDLLRVGKKVPPKPQRILPAHITNRTPMMEPAAPAFLQTKTTDQCIYKYTKMIISMM